MENIRLHVQETHYIQKSIHIFHFRLQEEDSKYFAYRDVNMTHVSVILAQSLEDLVDDDAPRNLLKFRLGCDYSDGTNSLVSIAITTPAILTAALIRPASALHGKWHARALMRLIN